MDNKKLSSVKNLIDQKQYHTALKKLTKMYAQEPNNSVLIFELAKLLVMVGKNDKARKYFESLTKVTNIGGYATYELAKLYESEGMIDVARLSYKSLLGGKVSASASYALGELEEREGNIEEAMKHYKSLIGTSKELQAILRLLDLSIHDNRYDESLIYLDKLIEYNQTDTALIQKYKFYIEYKFGNINVKKEKGYFNSQVVNYDRKKAIESIQLHLDEIGNKDNYGIFFSDISIEELFDTVQENTSCLKIKNYGLCDKYLFDLGYNVGTVNGKETSVIQVVTICNTYNIIAMYPVDMIYQTINDIKPKTKIQK